MPIWSVMIPVYRPNPVFFREAIKSVLLQSPGPDKMQIEVVDDCSPGTDVGRLVADIAGDRIQVFRTTKNLGLAGAWNTCLRRARGEWIHLFHQDDIVFPGFYAELENITGRYAEAGAAFTRHCFIDEQADCTMLSYAERRTPGLLSDWSFQLATEQRIQCAAIVVRRATYAAVGSFRSDLPYCLDWEMWGRVAARFPFAYSPKILAGYRRHSGSETARLAKTDATLADQIHAFEHLVSHLLPAPADAARTAFGQHLAPALLRQFFRHYVAGDLLRAADIFSLSKGLRLPPPIQKRFRATARKIRIKRLMQAVGLERK